MAGENENQEQDPGNDAVEAEARRMGWSEKDKWRGPEDKWVDASTFVERGKTILPIVQANNRKLQESIDQLRTQLKEATDGNKELRESIGAIEEFHNENLKQQVERVRTELKEQLKAAKKDGDVDAEVELTDKLTRLNSDEKKVEKAAETKPAEKKTEQTGPVDHNFNAWRAKPENAWFGADRKKTAMALEFGRDVAAERPDLRQSDGMPSAEFYAEVANRVEEFFTPKGQKFDKVSGSKTTKSGTDSGKAKTYDDLPEDAKAACAKFAERVVGPNKAHKDLKSWQAKYTKTFFETNNA